jgi:hypothetical protein
MAGREAGPIPCSARTAFFVCFARAWTLWMPACSRARPAGAEKWLRKPFVGFFSASQVGHVGQSELFTKG